MHEIIKENILITIESIDLIEERFSKISQPEDMISSNNGVLILDIRGRTTHNAFIPIGYLKIWAFFRPIPLFLTPKKGFLEIIGKTEKLVSWVT